MGITCSENLNKRKQSEFKPNITNHLKYDKKLAISTTNTKAKNEENSLKIDLLEEGQKIEQFKEMVNDQYFLDTYDILGASSNYYTTKVYIKGISNILQGFYNIYENHLSI